MSVGFVLLACCTAFDIVANIGSKAWPPEFGRDQLMGFEEARVTGGFMIMAALEDRTAEGIISRDIDTAFVSEDSGLNLPVSKVGVEWEEISLCIDWSACRIRGSLAEADSMHWDRAVSMRLIKRDGGSRVTPKLSSFSEERRAGW